jgi:hypothetical protein
MTDRPTRATSVGRTYLDLQNLARRTRRTTQELLHLYALEGFLARLTTSPYASNLVLKGGVLLAAYGARRATRDVDLQGRQVSNDLDTVLKIIQQVSAISIDDGLAFRPGTAAAQSIREDDNYHGVRVSLVAKIATAQINVPRRRQRRRSDLAGAAVRHGTRPTRPRHRGVRVPVGHGSRRKDRHSGGPGSDQHSMA